MGMRIPSMSAPDTVTWALNQSSWTLRNLELPPALLPT